MFKIISLSLEILQCNINKPKGDSLAPEAGKIEKITKTFKKLEKIAKHSINLSVCDCDTKTYSS